MSERLKSRRILIVEDEYFLADDLERVLRAEGAEVIGPISSLNEARGLIDDRLDAAVLDVKIQDGEVFAVADELSRLLVPFAFATGYDAETLPHRFRTRVRLEKPYTPLAVVGLIERLFEVRDRAHVVRST
jgi:DNA-binding NtrC family response regulator